MIDTSSHKKNIVFGMRIHLEAAAKDCFNNRHRTVSQKKEKLEIFISKLQRFLTAEYYEIHESVRKTLTVIRQYISSLGPA